MINPDEGTTKAIQRLIATPDFKMFLQMLADEKKEVDAEWRSSLNTVRVHQLQGTAQLLEDIAQAVMPATRAAAINHSPS